MPDRITYFSNQDLALWHSLPRVESILRSFDNNYSTSDINDVIELYHITLFIDNGVFANSWTDADVNDFKQKSNAIKKVIYKYFSLLLSSEIHDIYTQIEFNYQETFWEIINRFNLWGLVNDDSLSRILIEYR